MAGRLNDKTARELTEPGRYRADDGLYLEVRRTKAGTLSRSWTLRFQLNDKRRDMGLGSYPTVTLTEARKKANEARVLIARGDDPLTVRDTSRKATKVKPIPTFGATAKLVIADAQARTANKKVAYQWERHLGAAARSSGEWRSRP